MFKVFVTRPILSISFNILIFILGVVAALSLSIRQYPRSDVSTVTIRTVYIGADAELVRGFVTTPLERVVASADGIDYMESASEQGMSTITAHLKLNFDINVALTQIQNKVSQVRNDLPPEAEIPTITVENADSRIASMYLSFYGEKLETNQITDYLLRVVQPRLSAVSGVEKADILGARTIAMRIWLKPEKLAALKLTASDVLLALRNNNALGTPGTTRGTLISVNLVTNTDLETKEEFENLIVVSNPYGIVRLSDIADVVVGAETYNDEVRFNGEAATFMGIWALPNANVLDVIKRVRETIPEIEKNLPPGMKLGVPYDATVYIEDAIHEVLKTLTETIIIVLIVIYLFIGSLRSVLVPIIAVPLSLVGALGLMMAFGFSINLLTLLGVVLAVGLVVDDAIVVLENVERHVSEGMKPFDAALRTVKELTVPIVAMTITLAAVYTPIAFQGGLTGALFREFSLALAGAVVISGIVALTLSPMMAGKLTKEQSEPTRLKQRVNAFLDWLKNTYVAILKVLLASRGPVLAGAAFFLVFLPVIIMFSGGELAPREDQGIVFGIVQADPQSTIDQTMIYTNEIQEVFQSTPEYNKSFQVTNPTGGFSGILLKPFSERKRSAEQISQDLWGAMSVVPGVRIIMTTPPPLPGGSDFPVEMVISSTADAKEIVGYAQQLVGYGFMSGKFMFLDSELKYDLPRTEIVLDRDKIRTLGLTMRDVAQDLAAFTGGNYVNRFSIDGRSYKVIPQVKRVNRLNPESVLDSYVRVGSGTMVPVSSIATLHNQASARKLTRFQQLNSAKIQAAPVPGVSIDMALKMLETKAKEILPPGYVIDYSGESRQLRNETSSAFISFLLAVVLIYLVLAAQFESFRDPLIILVGSVPLALAGALIFVFLGFTTINTYSQVGLVTLMGLVAKNGILIVEFANHLMEAGLSKLEAVLEAAATRLRPILMTSVATVVGHFPLVIAVGPGAGARNSIGIVLVTGMVIGTVTTLFIVPMLYMLIAEEKREGHEEGM